MFPSDRQTRPRIDIRRSITTNKTVGVTDDISNSSGFFGATSGPSIHIIDKKILLTRDEVEAAVRSLGGDGVGEDERRQSILAELYKDLFERAVMEQERREASSPDSQTEQETAADQLKLFSVHTD